MLFYGEKFNNFFMMGTPSLNHFWLFMNDHRWSSVISGVGACLPIKMCTTHNALSLVFGSKQLYKALLISHVASPYHTIQMGRNVRTSGSRASAPGCRGGSARSDPNNFPTILCVDQFLEEIVTAMPTGLGPGRNDAERLPRLHVMRLQRTPHVGGDLPLPHPRPVHPWNKIGIGKDVFLIKIKTVQKK